MEKVMTVERVKNHEHIIGEEFNETYHVSHWTDVDTYIGEWLARLDGETFEFHQDQIDSIRNLENGQYNIDNGDFTLYVEISD